MRTAKLAPFLFLVFQMITGMGSDKPQESKPQESARSLAYKWRCVVNPLSCDPAEVKKARLQAAMAVLTAIGMIASGYGLYHYYRPQETVEGLEALLTSLEKVAKDQQDDLNEISNALASETFPIPGFNYPTKELAEAKQEDKYRAVQEANETITLLKERIERLKEQQRKKE